MNPNNQEELSSQLNNVSGDFVFSKTVLPGSTLEINQGNQALPKTILPSSPSLDINPEVKVGYTTFLEKRLQDLRKPVTAEISKAKPQTTTESAQPISENLTKEETIFTPPADQFQQQSVQQPPESLFDLPLPAPLGNIAPVAESVTKAVPLFNQTLNIPPTIPNIPPVNFNQVPNLNQFKSLPPAPAQNIKPVIQNNIVPGRNNITPQTISKPTQEVQTPEITIDDLKGIHLQKLKNGALNNAVKFQRMLSNARSV